MMFSYFSMYGQISPSKWITPESKHGTINFQRVNSYLGVADIKDSKNDIEIRLYIIGDDLNSMSNILVNKNLFDSYYYKRKKRKMDDSLTAIFPLKKYHVKNTNLDSIFLSLAAHNIFTLPDQSETDFPPHSADLTVQYKVNNRIYSYSFANPWYVKEDNQEEFKEYKTIAWIFDRLISEFVEKGN